MHPHSDLISSEVPSSDARKPVSMLRGSGGFTTYAQVFRCFCRNECYYSVLEYQLAHPIKQGSQFVNRVGIGAGVTLYRKPRKTPLVAS